MDSTSSIMGMFDEAVYKRRQNSSFGNNISSDVQFRMAQVAQKQEQKDPQQAQMMKIIFERAMDDAMHGKKSKTNPTK